MNGILAVLLFCKLLKKSPSGDKSPLGHALLYVFSLMLAPIGEIQGKCAPNLGCCRLLGGLHLH